MFAENFAGSAMPPAVPAAPRRLQARMMRTSTQSITTVQSAMRFRLPAVVRRSRLSIRASPLVIEQTFGATLATIAAPTEVIENSTRTKLVDAGARLGSMVSKSIVGGALNTYSATLHVGRGIVPVAINVERSRALVTPFETRQRLNFVKTESEALWSGPSGVGGIASLKVFLPLASVGQRCSIKLPKWWHLYIFRTMRFTSMCPRSLALRRAVREPGATVPPTLPRTGQTVDVKKAVSTQKMDVADIETTLHNLLSDIAGIEKLEPDSPLLEAGLDSLSAVAFRNALVGKFVGATLPSTLVLDYPSMRALASFLYEEMTPEDEDPTVTDTKGLKTVSASHLQIVVEKKPMKIQGRATLVGGSSGVESTLVAVPSSINERTRHAVHLVASTDCVRSRMAIPVSRRSSAPRSRPTTSSLTPHLVPQPWNSGGIAKKTSFAQNTSSQKLLDKNSDPGHNVRPMATVAIINCHHGGESWRATAPLFAALEVRAAWSSYLRMDRNASSKHLALASRRAHTVATMPTTWRAQRVRLAFQLVAIRLGSFATWTEPSCIGAKRVEDAKVTTKMADVALSSVRRELHEIEASLHELLVEMTGSDEVQVDTPLMEAGLDSLATVAFRSALVRNSGIESLPATLVLDYPSVRAISSFLHEVLTPEEQNQDELRKEKLVVSAEANDQPKVIGQRRSLNLRGRARLLHLQSGTSASPHVSNLSDPNERAPTLFAPVRFDSVIGGRMAIKVSGSRVRHPLKKPKAEAIQPPWSMTARVKPQIVVGEALRMRESRRGEKALQMRESRRGEIQSRGFTTSAVLNFHCGCGWSRVAASLEVSAAWSLNIRHVATTAVVLGGQAAGTVGRAGMVVSFSNVQQIAVALRSVAVRTGSLRAWMRSSAQMAAEKAPLVYDVPRRATEPRRPQSLVDVLATLKKTAEELGIDDSIDVDTSLMEIGFDSLQAVALRSTIQSTFGLQAVPMSMLSDESVSLRSFASYIHCEISQLPVETANAPRLASGSGSAMPVLPLMERTRKLPGDNMLPETIRAVLPPAGCSALAERAPVVRLLCCYGAADNVCQEWAFWHHAAPINVEMATYEVPGHGIREEEELMCTIDDWVNEAFDAFKDSMATGPFAVVGHSIGTIVATGVCRRARQELGVEPVAAFMLDRGPPNMAVLSELGLSRLKDDPLAFLESWVPAMATAAAGDSDKAKHLRRMWQHDMQLERDVRDVGWHTFRCPLFAFRAVAASGADYILLEMLPQEFRDKLMSNIELRSQEPPRKPRIVDDGTQVFIGFFERDEMLEWSQWTEHVAGATVTDVVGVDHFGMKASREVRESIWKTLSFLLDSPQQSARAPLVVEQSTDTELPLLLNSPQQSARAPLVVEQSTDTELLERDDADESDHSFKSACADSDVDDDPCPTDDLVAHMVSTIVTMISGGANELKGAFLLAGEQAVSSTLKEQLTAQVQWASAPVEVKSQVRAALRSEALRVGLEAALSEERKAFLYLSSFAPLAMRERMEATQRAGHERVIQGIIAGTLTAVEEIA